ncbi:Alpha/Beta hydrolase protein [Schizophyllum commune]
MPHLPLLGRLSLLEYAYLVAGFLFLALESVLHIIILFLPKAFINLCYEKSRTLFNRRHRAERPPSSPEKQVVDKILRARDFHGLCEIYGYTPEEHVVLTKDGYLLTLHRLCNKKGEHSAHPGTSTGGPVVYLHHGLLMNSEIWVCLTAEERALPFQLVERGYDVWLGNNRGNKYSRKSIHHGPHSAKFWDYSIDDFAWHDIPDSIHYILDVTKAPTLSYIGFSQGTAQAFAALSIHPQLNQKINVFIALAPAMAPPGLSAPIVDSLMKASPTLMYLFFGRKSILSSATMWQSILYPPIFAVLIDTCLGWLFRWYGNNIPSAQKIAAYAHLYSFASTKSVVHWFQIMRSATFQMFDDDVSAGVGSVARTRVSSYRPARFPTRNIVTPIVLMYGDSDSLVDIKVMTKNLPNHTRVVRLHGYEHLDILWGKDVTTDVFPHVYEVLDEFKEGGDLGVSTPELQYTNGKL